MKRGAKKTVKAPTGRFRIFGFTINPHELLLVAEDGRKVAQLKVESAADAREQFMSERLNEQLVSTLGRADFSTIWVEDPAGDPEVMEACRKMEQGEADALLSGAMNVDLLEPGLPQTGADPEETVAADPAVSDPNVNGEVSVHTPGVVFQTEVDGEFRNIPGQLLRIDDVCRFFPERASVDETLWRVVASPVDVGDDDYLIQLRKMDTAGTPAASEEEPPAERLTENPDSGRKTKVIEVECAETYSEHEIKMVGRQLRALKSEALSSAAGYRDDIKKLEKRFFDMCEGKSYTQMECTVENDWEAGERRYIRPDTGEVALREQIPHEERQLSMDLPLPEENPGEEETDDAAPETAAAAPVPDEPPQEPEEEGDDTEGYFFGDGQQSDQLYERDPDPLFEAGRELYDQNHCMGA